MAKRAFFGAFLPPRLPPAAPVFSECASRLSAHSSALANNTRGSTGSSVSRNRPNRKAVIALWLHKEMVALLGVEPNYESDLTYSIHPATQILADALRSAADHDVDVDVRKVAIHLYDYPGTVGH